VMAPRRGTSISTKRMAVKGDSHAHQALQIRLDKNDIPYDCQRGDVTGS
jgi:hypothetical protein